MFQISVAVPPAPVLVSSLRPLAPSVISDTSFSNDKVDNDMIPGAVSTSLGICPKAAENPGKPLLGDRLLN